MNDTATHQVAAQTANFSKTSEAHRCTALHDSALSALTVIANVNETLKFGADTLRGNLLQKSATHKRIHADSAFLLTSD